MLCGEKLARTPEAGGDLIEDQQDVVPVADVAQVGEVSRVMEPHAARALDDGLHDDRGEFVGVLRQLLFEGGDVGGVVVAGHLGCEHLSRQDVGPQRVHPAVRVADAHRRERVAVIATPPRHQPVLGRAAEAALVLQRHLHSHLYGHRPGVAEKDGVQPVGGDVDEQLCQPGGGLVGEAPEHDVVHPGQLRGDRVVEGGMPVAVDRGPPRAHRVEHLDTLAVVDQGQPRATGPYRDDGWHRLGADRAVGMPDMGGVDGADLSGVQRGHEERA